MTTHTLRLAHRGDFRADRENTIGAFAAAMRVVGCDGVELDVRLARDGTPVVLHDETLLRVQGFERRVSELDVATLEATGVPTLARALAAVPAAWLDVELKPDEHGEATAAVLREARGETPSNAAVSSFHAPSLAAVGDRLPGWDRWLNAIDLRPATLELAVALGCRAVAVLWGAITPASIGQARAAGLEVAAWTVRDRPTFERLEQLGVIACCVEAEALGDAVPAAVPG